jgi:hypothetical protein
MRSVCPIVNTIPISHPGDDIETLELLQFRLHGADGKTGSSLNLSHVKRCIGRNTLSEITLKKCAFQLDFTSFISLSKQAGQIPWLNLASVWSLTYFSTWFQ